MTTGKLYGVYIVEVVALAMPVLASVQMRPAAMTRVTQAMTAVMRATTSLRTKEIDTQMPTPAFLLFKPSRKSGGAKSLLTMLLDDLDGYHVRTWD